MLTNGLGFAVCVVSLLLLSFCVVLCLCLCCVRVCSLFKRVVNVLWFDGLFGVCVLIFGRVIVVGLLLLCLRVLACVRLLLLFVLSVWFC